MRLIVLLTVGLALSGIAFAQDKPENKPNVLFIAVDDLNDWVNCLGGRAGVHTPHLDGLAARGVLFANAHCSAPACNPSRASIMTGVNPATSGVYNNSQNWRSAPALKNAVTIPEFFRSQGYSVRGGGKIFHALSWIRRGYGKQRNDPTIWDRYFPSMDKPMPDAAWPEDHRISEQGYVNWTPLAQGTGDTGGKRPSHFFDFGSLPVRDRDMADTKVVDWAARELQRKHDRPFFLAVGLFRPHIPWFTPQPYFDRYPLDELNLPTIQADDLADCSPVAVKGWVRQRWQKWLVENDLWKSAVQGYLASISFADAQIGRLMAALDQSGHVDNTIIVLWSDHGMHIGEKEHWEKFTLWEESTRVPLMIVAPGITQPASVSMRPVSLVDVFPTLVDLVGQSPMTQLDGVSLVPWLRDPAKPKQQPALTTWGANNHSVRTDHWRYIRYHNGDEELYDHRTDPDEFINLATHPEHETLKQALARWMPRTSATPAAN